MTILRMFDKKGDHVADFNYDAGALLIPADDLRDRFAMAALQGMLAHPTRYRPRAGDEGLTFHQAISREAYELADAMMEARGK